MKIVPNHLTKQGEPKWFTGADVWIDSIAGKQGPGRAVVSVSQVRFMPGARTAWHCHDDGQTLFVTEGEGLAQSRGGEVIRVRPGDVIYTEPGEWHWHGAAPGHYMTHLTVTEGPTQLGDHVPEADYVAADSAGR